MSRYVETKLGEIAKTNTTSYSEKEKWNFVNYLDTGSITQNVIESVQYIDLNTEKLPSRAKRKVRKNSIVYSTVRPNQLHYGIIKSQPENFLVSTGFTVIDVNEAKADADYIFYYLTQRDIVEHLQAIGEQSTSAYPSIKASDIEDLVLFLPPLEEQKKIVEILNAITNRISNNTAINNNLEQQATTMFRRFYDSSNNTVPFTSMIRVLGGGTPKTGEPSFWNGTIPFFTPKDVGSPYSFNTEKTITEEGLNHCNSRLYPQNTVFVTARGTVGKVSMAGLPMAMNQSCYALVGINIDQILAYHYTLVTINKLKHKATGAVFDAIITKDFETESISRLTDKDAEDFLAVAKPIYSAILTNSLENQRLISLRDTLLPRLMSGKLDLSDVDF